MRYSVPSSGQYTVSYSYILQEYVINMGSRLVAAGDLILTGSGVYLVTSVVGANAYVAWQPTPISYDNVKVYCYGWRCIKDLSELERLLMVPDLK